MIDLSRRTELYEVGLSCLKVIVRPLTTAGMAAAQAAARRAVQAIERRTETGLPLERLSDLSAARTASTP